MQNDRRPSWGRLFHFADQTVGNGLVGLPRLEEGIRVMAVDTVHSRFPDSQQMEGHSNPSVTLAIYATAFEEAELEHKNDMGLAFPMR